MSAAPRPFDSYGARTAAVPQDEILTGEAVALDIQPLGFFMRFLGALIDIVAMVLLLILVLIGLVSILQERLTQGTVAIISIVTLVLAWVVIPTTIETVTRGRSLGKLAVGGRIVRSDGGAIGFRQAFLRAMVGVLEIYMTGGGIAVLVGIFTPRSQRLGDLVAGTYCERTRTPRVTDSPVILPFPLAEWAAIADVSRLPLPLSRRMTQFVHNADGLMPGARMRLASELAEEASPYVLPLPPVDPETLVRGIIAVRTQREFRALMLQNERTARLTAGTF